jgi:hypothetical protein
MSQPITRKSHMRISRRRSPLVLELKALTTRVEELETQVKEMHETIYGLYGLQETVGRLDPGGH